MAKIWEDVKKVQTSDNRQLSSDHRRELGQFFNTTSAVLDTTGSMTENSILQSVEFDKEDNSKKRLFGSGIDNAPQPKLPPTDINISRYVAFFPDYQLDNGHIVKPNPTLCSAIFSMDYPPVPELKSFEKIQTYLYMTRSILPTTIPPQMRVLTFLHPMMRKTIVTIATKATTDKSIDFSSSDDEENNSDNSEQSYV